MDVGSDRESCEQTDRGEPGDRGGPGHREESGGRGEPDDHEESGDHSVPSGRPEPSDSVHVRRLDVADTLRWSWATLRDRPELVAVALAANLPAVAAAVGVTRPSPSADLDVAAWVWAAYLVQFVAVAIAAGVAYLTAADAVAYRSRPLAARVRVAARRVPSLIGTGLVFVVAVGIGLAPAYLFEEGLLSAVGDGLLAVLSVLAALFAAYAFHRLLLAFPACVVDGTGPIASARTGWAAGAGTVRKVFAVGVVYAVASVASAVASGLFGGEYDVPSTLASAATGAVLLPFFGLALAHLYLEGSRNR